MNFRKTFQGIRQDREILVTILRAFMVRGVAAFGTLLLNVVIARLLGVKGLGLFMLAFTVLVGLSTIARFGMENALLRFAGTAWGTGKAGRFRGVCLQAAWRVGLCSLVLASGLYLFAPWVAKAVFSEPTMASLLRIMALVLIPYTAMYIFSTLLKATGWTTVAPLFENGGISLLSACLVLLAYFMWQSMSVNAAGWILVTAAVMLSLISLILTLLRTWTFIQRVEETSGEPELGGVAYTFLLTTMVTFAIQWSSSLILGGFGSAEDVGLFNAAQRTAFVITFILMVFNGVLPPRIATLHSEGNHKELETMVLRSTLYMTVVAMPLAALFIFFPGQVLALFGSEFREAAPHLLLLSIAQFINVCTGSVGVLLNMTGNEKIMRNLVFCVGGSGFLMAMALIPLLGIWGATISLIAAIVGQNLLAAWYVNVKLNIKVIPGWRLLVGK